MRLNPETSRAHHSTSTTREKNFVLTAVHSKPLTLPRKSRGSCCSPIVRTFPAYGSLGQRLHAPRKGGGGPLAPPTDALDSGEPGSLPSHRRVAASDTRS